MIRAMRKFVIIPFIILLACSTVHAQRSGASNVAVSDLKMVVVDDYVDISFVATIANNAAKSSYTLFAVPTLTNNVTRLPLAAIVVQGKRAQIAEKRYAMARIYPGLGQPIHADNGQRVAYSISVPYESWMSNVSLVMDKYERGCCDDVVMPSELVAQNIALGAPAPRREEPVQQIIAQPVPEPVAQMPVAQPVRVAPTPQRTIISAPNPCDPPQPSYNIIDNPDCLDDSFFSTADKLARHFSFIAPIPDYDAARRKSRTGVLFDYNMPLNLGRGISRAQQNDLDLFIDENRDESLSIYFRSGSDIVDRTYADNGYALVDMISCIRAIQSSDDCRIVKIIIAGFASPEGSFLANDRLAWERAVAVKEIMLNNTNLSNRVVSIYNGSVDWRGLYRLVAQSDMYHKYQILNIIDLAPIVGDARYASRMDELKRLNNGEPYKYMLNNIFPLLRNAAYIKIYYENLNNTYIVTP